MMITMVMMITMIMIFFLNLKSLHNYATCDKEGGGLRPAGNTKPEEKT